MPKEIGNPKNEEVSKIKENLFGFNEGKVSIRTKGNSRAASVVVSNDNVRIVNSNTSSGICVDNDGVGIQGVVYFTGSGTSIGKGVFSENPNSAKLFTYQETVILESIPKEIISPALGKTGINSGFGMDGMIPIMTDISAGPLPHFHSISMKHVHRTEPAYLYKVPTSVRFIAGAISSLKSFFLS